MNALSTMLRVDQLWVSYGRKDVLRGLSLAVEPGEVVALLGDNASGKSTTLKVLAGLVPARAGSVEYCGQPLPSLCPEQRHTLGIGYVMQGGRVFPNLTVDDNLRLAARPGTLPSTNPLDAYEWFPGLAKFRYIRAGLLSGGFRQMLALSMVHTQSPKLLLLDEPMASLTEEAATAWLQRLRDLVEARKLGAILVEQKAHLARRFAHRSLVLIGGRTAS